MTLRGINNPSAGDCAAAGMALAATRTRARPVRLSIMVDAVSWGWGVPNESDAIDSGPPPNCGSGRACATPKMQPLFPFAPTGERSIDGFRRCDPGNPGPAHFEGAFAGADARL